MSASYQVYNGDIGGSGAPPRRPVVADVGGAAFVDDQASPPDPTQFTVAADENQKENLLVGYARVMAVCRITMTFPAGVATVASVVAVGTNILTSTFTLTENAAGDTTIAWPANTFPVSNSKPRITLDDDLAMLAPTYVLGTNNIRVKTRNSASTLVDCAFTLDLSGQLG